jgi:hypothetical protein
LAAAPESSLPLAELEFMPILSEASMKPPMPVTEPTADISEIS